jgi:transcriptional regulator with XRE-family HTH domain
MLGYLNGNSSPSLEKLRQIAESQGVTVGWLVDDETIISNSTGKNQIVTGNGIVTAGGKITGSVQVRDEAGQKIPMEGFLDDEELSLITMIRDLGGRRIIKRFKEELKRIQKIVDGE